MARALSRHRGLRAALIVAAVGTATLTLGSTAALAATNSAAGRTTAAATTAAAACSPGSCVPVFNTDGVEVALAVVNPVTGQVDLVGPAGNIIGVVEQVGSSVDVIGANGAVIGTLFVNSATGQVIFAPV